MKSEKKTLQEWLAWNGISQRKFAARLDTTDAAVSCWVSGKRRPSVTQLAAIEHVTMGAVGASSFLTDEEKASIYKP